MATGGENRGMKMSLETPAMIMNPHLVDLLPKNWIV